MTFTKCPRCNHMSVKPINTSEVIGLIECSRGGKSVANKIQRGTKCVLCNYNNIRTEVIDSRGHRVI